MLVITQAWHKSAKIVAQNRSSYKHNCNKKKLHCCWQKATLEFWCFKCSLLHGDFTEKQQWAPRHSFRVLWPLSKENVQSGRNLPRGKKVSTLEHRQRPGRKPTWPSLIHELWNRNWPQSRYGGPSGTIHKLYLHLQIQSWVVATLGSNTGPWPPQWGRAPRQQPQTKPGGPCHKENETDLGVQMFPTPLKNFRFELKSIYLNVRL